MPGDDRRSRILLSLALGVCLYTIDSRTARAALSLERPLEVRLLYDNSGSMYSGYAPPGRTGTPRSVSGARYFYQYPEFQEWLADFVARQSIVNGDMVSMSILTSGSGFTPSDLRQVHPRVPLGAFEVRRAVGAFPLEPGDMTYLTEGLDQFTRGFEGLVWLITDNIVETSLGQPDREVDRFFRTLRNQPRYRSVHLFKYPFRDSRTGQQAALAIYGILVSDAEVSQAFLTRLDGKLHSEFRVARRRRGNPPPQLFPGQEHLKLKDLSIDPIWLDTPSLQVVIESRDRRLFEEKQTVRLELRGVIRSNLTQHSVTAGRYTLEPDGPFMPDERSRQQLGVSTLPSETFQGVSGSLQDTIPPTGSQNIATSLPSRAPISLSFSSFAGWLQAALRGGVVQYTGPVKMSFGEVSIRLERDRMAGIFGIDRASSIFDIQDVRTIRVRPSTVQVSFALGTSSQRTLLLLLTCAVLAIPAVLASLALRRPQHYRIEISGSPGSVVALRRFASREILHEGHRLGRLSRRLGGSHSFEPAAATAGVSVIPFKQEGSYDVRIREHGYRLTIQPLAHGSNAPQKRSGGDRPHIPIVTGGGRPPLNSPLSPRAIQPSPPQGAPKTRPKIGRP